MRRIAVALLLLSTATVASAQLYFLRDNTGQLYSLSTSTGAATQVAIISAVTSNTIGATESPTPGLMYGSTYQNLVSFRTDGTNMHVIGPINGGGGAEGLAFCIPSGILYASINGTFFTINPSTGALVTNLAAPLGGADVEGLACDHTHNIVYGMSGFSGPKGDLYRYTPGTDTWAFVGNAGVPFLENGLAYDTAKGVLYALGSQDGNLYSINPVTAAATVIGPTGLGPVGGGLAMFPVLAPIPTLSLGALAGLLLAIGLLSAYMLKRMERTRIV